MSLYLRLFASLAGLLLMAAITSACSSQASEPAPDPGETTPPARSTLPALIETGQPPDSPVSQTPLPAQGTAPVTGEVPQALLQAIMADLSARTGVAPAAMAVVRAESVVWGDGSLGCPEPGMMYTQALVDGYWVVLKVNAREYDYRASQTGYFRLCEGKGGGPVVGPAGEPVESPDR